MINQFVSALFLLIYCVACASAGHGRLIQPGSKVLIPDDLLIPANFDFKNNRDLSRSAVEYDVALLDYALNTGYAGRSFINEDKFKIVMGELSQISKQLQYPANSVELSEKIDEILLTLPDNHLQAQSALGMTKARKRTERKGAVGANIGEVNANPWALKVLQGRQQSFSILSITSFPPKEDRRWTGIEAVIERWLQQPVAVLDLRGNTGGSDEMGSWLASRVNGGTFESPYKYRMDSQTPETFALLANYLKFQADMTFFGSSPSLNFFSRELTLARKNMMLQRLVG